jgi:hypothetical protein
MTRLGLTQAAADHFVGVNKMVLPATFNPVEFYGIGTCSRFISTP